MVDIPVRNPAESDTLPGDVDVDVGIHRVIGQVLLSELRLTGLIIKLTGEVTAGVTGGNVLASPVGLAGFDHGQSSSVTNTRNNHYTYSKQ